MLDLFSRNYLNTAELNFLRLLAIMLGRIAKRDEKKNPGRAVQLGALLDVLTGWMPLASGVGHLRLDLRRVGVVDIDLRDSALTISVTPWFPLGIKTSIHQVFFAVPGMPVVSSRDGMRFAVNVIERASARTGSIDGYADFCVRWDSLPGPLPSKTWIERREAAIQAGGVPPRAVHWVLDRNES